MVWPEGLDNLKKFNELIGTRTHNLPACNTAPQTSVLLHAELQPLGNGNDCNITQPTESEDGRDYMHL
jgi:hypothetical protein